MIINLLRLVVLLMKITNTFRPLKALPCSTTEREQGLSLMNAIMSPERSALLLTNVSALMSFQGLYLSRSSLV